MVGFSWILLTAEPSSHQRRGSTHRCVWPALLQACRNGKRRGCLHFPSVAGGGEGCQRQVCNDGLSCLHPYRPLSSLQRNNQFLSLFMCLSLRRAFLTKIEARTLKATGLGVGSDMGEWVQSEAYLPLSSEYLCAQTFAEMECSLQSWCGYIWLIFLWSSADKAAFLDSHVRSSTE